LEWRNKKKVHKRLKKGNGKERGDRRKRSVGRAGGDTEMEYRGTRGSKTQTSQSKKSQGKEVESKVGGERNHTLPKKRKQGQSNKSGQGEASQLETKKGTVAPEKVSETKNNKESRGRKRMTWG